MDKESVLQKRNRAEHSSLLIVSAGFLLLCTCEVFGIITGKLWIGQREIVFGGTLFFIMFLSQFALNLKYYLIDKKKWADCRGDFTDLLYRTYDFQNFESRTLSYGISLR